MSDLPLSDPAQKSHEEAVRLLIDGDTPWDRWLLRASNWLNPILVKETRQALKSKQFSWTFLLLITIAIGWTLIGILSSIPNIYYDADGSVFLMGYLIILLFPSMLVIPQATFRSMASELEDGTFETLSLSLLKPSQIIYGKLSVAILQLILYLSILAPCIALTYLLQGVTLEIIAALLLIIISVCIFLCTIAIFLAATARNRVVQVLFSVVMIGLQLVAGGTLFGFIVQIVREQSLGWEGWMATVLTLLALAAYGWLWMRCASSLIDMPSANRSTPIRIAVFVVGTAIAVCGAFMVLLNQGDLGADAPQIACVVANLCWIHWAVAGGWMMGESGIITNRARRSLPDSYFGRIFLTWFNPGAGPAYLLIVLGFVGPWIAFFVVLTVVNFAASSSKAMEDIAFSGWVYVSALAAYLALYLGIVRLTLLILFRKSRAPRMLLSFAMVFVMFILSIILSLSLSLAAGGYRDMDFDWYCFINPIWTLGELFPSMYQAVQGVSIFDNAEELLAWLALLGSASIVFIINAVFTARDVMVSRIETPPRVLAERPSNKPKEEAPSWEEL
jgi:ABC-type transport system involved in cytochrome c biogenesis permease component